MKQYRHGDVFLNEILEFPSDRRLVQSWVEDNEATLLQGEATGHAHKLKGNFVLYKAEGGDLYFEVKGDTKLTHEEHHTIDLSIGKYAMIRQRVYTPKELKYVID